MKRVVSGLLIALLLSFSNPCLAELQNEINVSLTQIPLNSKLKKQYAGYKYVIQNNSNQDLNLVNAQIENGTNGSIAYQAVDNGHPIGVTWAICGPLGLFTFGIGWAVGLFATPVVWIVSNSKNGKARIESNAYPSIVNLGYINRGESVTVNTLVPIGAQPQLKMTFQTQKDKEFVIVNK